MWAVHIMYVVNNDRTSSGQAVSMIVGRLHTCDKRANGADGTGSSDKRAAVGTSSLQYLRYVPYRRAAAKSGMRWRANQLSSLVAGKAGNTSTRPLIGCRPH